ncbi:MAG: hypothetical protein DRJ40_02185 [Thermoprotei archaeon]|nr:MAG: hypothetical protein DRJ40_02185 [Thermoprotei archaeon]
MIYTTENSRRTMELTKLEIKILDMLAKYGKPLSINVLTKKLGIKESMVKKALKQLEKKDLIERIPWHYIRSRTGKIIAKVPNRWRIKDRGLEVLRNYVNNQTISDQDN